MTNYFYSVLLLVLKYLNILSSYLHTIFAFLFDNPLSQNIYSGIIYILVLVFLLYLFIYSFLQMAKNNLPTKNIYVILISLGVAAYIFFSSLQEEPIKKSRSQETDINLFLYLIFIILYSLYTTPSIFNYININLSNIILINPNNIDNLIKYISVFAVLFVSISFLSPLKIIIQHLTSSNIYGKVFMLLFFILFIVLVLSILNKILGFAKINYTSNVDFGLIPYLKMLSLFVLFAPILLYTIFSSFDEIIKFIKYNYGVIFILINIILFPLFYSNNSISKSLLGNKYTYVYISIQLLSFLYFFYIKSNISTSEANYSILYERIKYILLFFLLLLFITLIYILDKENRSGYIKNLHLISLFMGLIFIYLLITLDLKFEGTFKLFKELYYDKCTETSNNILDLTYNNILLLFIGFVFALSCLVIFIGIVKFPGGFLNDETNSPYILVILYLYFVIWFLFYIIKIFPKVLSVPITPKTIYTTNRYSRAYMTVLSFIIVFIFLSYVIQFINNLKKGSNLLSSFINILLLIVIYIIVQKFISPQPVKPQSNDTLANTINNYITFLQTIITFDNFKKVLNNPTTISSIIICLFILPYIVFSLIKPSSSYKNNSTLLLNHEITLQHKKLLATYQELNTHNNPETYNYAISFWVYINAVPKYNNMQHTILSYDDNPMIKFDTQNNTLIVSIKPYNSKKRDSIIVIKKFKLQKWNNIVINYTPGHLDIFLNTKLVFTIEQNLMYLETSYLYIGDDNGINGLISDVEYFKSPITKNDINLMYDLSRYLIK